MILYLHGFASGPGSAKGRALEERFAAEGVALRRADLTPGERTMRATSPPSSSGISQSRITMSGAKVRIASRPETPSPAS